jgi:glycosyltransferase involved in cell wall biosynthesis
MGSSTLRKTFVTGGAGSSAHPAAHNRLRILFCTLGYHPGPGSGAEHQARLQADELVRRGHHVTVVCPSYAGVSSGWAGGVFVRRLPWLRRWLQTWTWSYLPVLAVFLVFRVRRFDLVHVHYAGVQADVVSLVAGLLRRPIYVKLGGGGRERELRPIRLVAWLTRSAGVRRATRVQATSDQIAAGLLELGVPRKRIVRLPNGLDTARFLERCEKDQVAARQALGLPADRVIVLYAGRFARVKGVADLLDTWTVTSQLQDAVLVLVGSHELAVDDPIGPVEENERVIVRDWTKDIRDYYRASDIFVLPSHGEGMSNALLEAMACGLAVVATRVGAAPEMIRDGIDGLLVEPGDRLGLGVALSRVVQDPGLRKRIGHATASTVRDRYAIQSVVAAIESTYLEIADRARAVT